MTLGYRYILGGLAACIALAACSEQEEVTRAGISGDFTVVAIRRASDVAGGPNDGSAENLMGRTAHFGETLQWVDGFECADWSMSETVEPVITVDDPLLSDTQVAPLDGPQSSGDKRQNKNIELLCDGRFIAALLQVDQRILVWSTASGLSNVILERPLAPQQIEAFQRELKSIKFFSGDPATEWDEVSLRSMALYAQYRGAAYTFNRAAITENLMDGLGILEMPIEVSAPDTVVPDTAEPETATDTETSARDPLANRGFAGYQPKLSEDRLFDYRPMLAMGIASLPAAELENLGALMAELEEAADLARKNPGQWEAGNVAIGADPMEYIPSDEELIAAEVGDRIGKIVETSDPVAFAGAWSGLNRGGKPSGDKPSGDKTPGNKSPGNKSIEYLGFDFRHVDVMGSGRFFYASEPKPRSLPIPGTQAE